MFQVQARSHTDHWLSHYRQFAQEAQLIKFMLIYVGERLDFNVSQADMLLPHVFQCVASWSHLVHLRVSVDALVWAALVPWH